MRLPPELLELVLAYAPIHCALVLGSSASPARQHAQGLLELLYKSNRNNVGSVVRNIALDLRQVLWIIEHYGPLLDFEVDDLLERACNGRCDEVVAILVQEYPHISMRWYNLMTLSQTGYRKHVCALARYGFQHTRAEYEASFQTLLKWTGKDMVPDELICALIECADPAWLKETLP